MSFLKRRLICFAEKFFVSLGKYPIDIFPTMVYNTNITLSRVVEESGPVKPGNPAEMSRRCQILRYDPEDEELYVMKASRREKPFLFFRRYI